MFKCVFFSWVFAVANAILKFRPNGTVKPITCLVCGICVTIIFQPQVSSAGFMLQPVSAFTTTGTQFGAIDNTRNQSGLSIPYISGVTDFDTYINSDPRHNSLPSANQWTSTSLTGDVDFDLGGSFFIDKMAFWGLGFNSTSSITAFELLVSDTEDFSSSTSVGNYSPLILGAPRVQTFAIPVTQASYVRMSVTATNGSPFDIGEVAFSSVPEPSAVPEPSTLALLTVAGLGIGGYHWRRRRLKRDLK